MRGNVKAIIKPFILALFFLAVSIAQPLTDILVNDEPDSNGFIAKNASVHYFAPDKFLAIWHESRSKDNFGYARFFNAQLQPRRRFFSRGTFKIDLNWSGYAAGVYFIRVATGQHAVIKKVDVMR